MIEKDLTGGLEANTMSFAVLQRERSDKKGTAAKALACGVIEEVDLFDPRYRSRIRSATFRTTEQPGAANSP